MRFVTAGNPKKRTESHGQEAIGPTTGWLLGGNTFYFTSRVSRSSEGREDAATTGATPSPPMYEHTPLIRSRPQFIGNNDERWLKVCACIATVVLGTVILAASKTDGPGRQRRETRKGSDWLGNAAATQRMHAGMPSSQGSDR